MSRELGVIHWQPVLWWPVQTQFMQTYHAQLNLFESLVHCKLFTVVITRNTSPSQVSRSTPFASLSIAYVADTYNVCAESEYRPSCSGGDALLCLDSFRGRVDLGRALGRFYYESEPRALQSTGCWAHCQDCLWSLPQLGPNQVCNLLVANLCSMVMCEIWLMRSTINDKLLPSSLPGH